MAMAALVISIGCDKKPAEKKETPKATPAAADGAAEGAAEKTGDGAATAKTSGSQSVSLKLPGMT